MVAGIVFLVFIMAVAFVVIWYVQNDSVDNRKTGKGLLAMRAPDKGSDDDTSTPGGPAGRTG